MQITLREYSDNDWRELLALTKKLHSHIKSLDLLQRIQNQPCYAEMSLHDILENVTKYQGKIWFAQDKGKTVGYIIGVIWKQSEKNALEIGRHVLGEVIEIYVNENYRKKGVGKMMIGKMEEYFKEKGCDSVWVSVFASNDSARQMYRKSRFVEREIGMLKEI
jgi:ribosomal protein S18 acetylase RimI-like enzyme